MLKSFLNKNLLEAGCDEAGRGPLAGPVFAAAVILPPDFSNETLDDSKKLSEKKRLELRKLIESEAVCFAVASISVEEIDRTNILRASVKAMHGAIAKLDPVPRHLLVDGNRFNPYPGIPHTTIIKGDSLFMSIAAASILAKTYRDEHMKKLHLEYPGYGWNRNKGYPTLQHREAIRTIGITPHHRKSFNLNQLRLKFH